MSLDIESQVFCGQGGLGLHQHLSAIQVLSLRFNVSFHATQVSDISERLRNIDVLRAVVRVYGNALRPTGSSPWGMRMQIALLFPKLS